MVAVAQVCQSIVHHLMTDWRSVRILPAATLF